MDCSVRNEDQDYAYVDQLLDLIGFARRGVDRDTEILFEEGSVSLGERFQLIDAYLRVENVLNAHEAEQEFEEGLFIDSVDLVLGSST